MDEYISRNALLQTHAENKPLNWTDTEAEIQAVNDWAAFNSLVESIPAADVTEVKHGKWGKEKWMNTHQHICSCCFATVRVHPESCEYKYCPYCGAKMDGKAGTENG